jgi:predicted nuclease of predicted toxin-antitoxin system
VATRVLTDEHISPTVAHRLVALGFDVVCVRDRGLLGWKDWQLMPWCIEHHRTICTNNGPDFVREHDRCLARGDDHPGVLIIGDWTPDEIYWALRSFLEEASERTLTNTVVFLEKATPEFIRARTDE